jgi:hypothetical protein
MMIDKSDTECPYSGMACSICGKMSSAVWSGETTIFVCSECAVNILPALIADAVSTSHMKDIGGLSSTLARIEAVYWRAASNNMARIARRVK